jgi:hypothetical protein
VAEVPVFDGGPFPASAAAIEDAEIAYISRRDCQAYYMEHLEVLQVEGARLRWLVEIIEELSFSKIRQRPITALVKLAQNEGTKTARGIEFQLPATHQELANQLGIVRELTSRSLMRLQVEGLLDVDARQIVDKDDGRQLEIPVATVVFEFLFTRLKLIEIRTATKAARFSTTIFLSGGIIGTFHHLYFAGTTPAVIGLGAIFSAFEVVPLSLMVILSMLPVGLLQSWASVEHGTWYARSAEFMQSGTMQTLRWMRVPGDILFSIGAALFAWFILGLLTGHSYSKSLSADQSAPASDDVDHRNIELAGR